MTKLVVTHLCYCLQVATRSSGMLHDSERSPDDNTYSIKSSWYLIWPFSGLQHANSPRKSRSSDFLLLLNFLGEMKNCLDLNLLFLSVTKMEIGAFGHWYQVDGDAAALAASRFKFVKQIGSVVGKTASLYAAGTEKPSSLHRLQLVRKAATQLSTGARKRYQFWLPVCLRMDFKDFIACFECFKWVVWVSPSWKFYQMVLDILRSRLSNNDRAGSVARTMFWSSLRI